MDTNKDQRPTIRYSDNTPTKLFALNIFESTAVRIDNLHSELCVVDVLDLFSKFGEMKNLKVYEKNWSSNRFAFVYYSTKVSAEKARSEMHFKRYTSLTASKNALLVTYADTQKKRAKWYIRTAISCGECFYWRVYGKCKQLESKQCGFAHHDYCDRADQDSYIKKTVKYENCDQSDPKVFCSPKKKFGFLQDYYYEELQERYNHLIRDILKIDRLPENSKHNFTDKHNKSLFDAVKTQKMEGKDSVFVMIIKKEEPMTFWPVITKN